MSFSLAVPGARLFTNEINIGISKGHRSSRPVPISGALREEIQHWLFLEDWTGYLPWRQELHHQIKLYSDASSFAWACILGPNARGAVIRDYWPSDQCDLHINVKETLALVHALEAFCFSLQVLIKTRKSQGAKSHALADVLKRLFSVVTSSKYSSQSLLYSFRMQSSGCSLPHFVLAG